MISKEEIKKCAQIKYDCLKVNVTELLDASEFIYYQTPTYIATQLEKMLSNKQYKLLLSKRALSYEESPKIVAFAIVKEPDFLKGKERAKSIIEEFYVSPECQNNGVGNNLLKTITDNFNKYPIQIKIIEKNRHMAHLLIKNGFKETLKRNFPLVYGKNSIDVFYRYYRKEGTGNEGNLL